MDVRSRNWPICTWDGAFIIVRRHYLMIKDGRIKALAKETAIYGMSSIIGRFLNYLLVPIYTNALPVESGGYGIITNMYAITALLMVLLTYGMETGFFRFANKGVDDPMRVYSTTLLSVGATALLF